MAHITFIHGISNKPEKEKLLAIWKQALMEDQFGNDDGIDLDTEGITCSMVYWADIMYAEPLQEKSIEEEALSSGEVDGFESAGGAEPAVEKGANEPDMAWRAAISGEEKEMVDMLAAKLNFDVLVNDTFTPPGQEADKNLERIPLPWFIKRILMKQLLRDVHHYLFNEQFSPRPGDTYQVQDIIRERMLEGLREGAAQQGPHIVVSHSMGTVIAYDCLARVANCPRVDGLMTIGSPLGIDEVQDKLVPTGGGRRLDPTNAFPAKVGGRWTNVYDPLDPVTGFDGNIANDFRQGNKEVIEVISESNWGSWRHNISKYLSKPKLRAALRAHLGL